MEKSVTVGNKRNMIIAFVKEAKEEDIEKLIDYMEEEKILIEEPELPCNVTESYITEEYFNERKRHFDEVVKEILKKIDHKMTLSHIFLLIARLLASFINKRTTLIGSLVKIPKHYYKEVDYPKRYSVYVL